VYPSAAIISRSSARTTSSKSPMSALAGVLIKLFVSLILPRQKTLSTLFVTYRRTVSHVNHGIALCTVDFAGVTSANYAERNRITVVEIKSSWRLRSRLARSAKKQRAFHSYASTRNGCIDIESIKRNTPYERVASSPLFIRTHP